MKSYIICLLTLILIVSCEEPAVNPDTPADGIRFSVNGVSYDLTHGYIPQVTSTNNSQGLLEHTLVIVTSDIEIEKMEDIYQQDGVYIVLGSIFTQTQYINPGTYRVGSEANNQSIKTALIHIKGNAEALIGKVEIYRDRKRYGFDFDLKVENTRAEVKGDWKGYLQLID